MHVATAQHNQHLQHSLQHHQQKQQSKHTNMLSRKSKSKKSSTSARSQSVSSSGGLCNEDMFAQAHHLQTTVSHITPNDDLLGLHSSPINANANATTNELLSLDNHPMPTADLLGFAIDNNGLAEEQPMPQATSATLDHNHASHDSKKLNQELLSLNFAPTHSSTSMQLNDAYIALEQMRVANLHIEFGTSKINEHKCVQCVRNKPYTSSTLKSFRYKHDKPCLMCGSPTCKKHSDANFLQSKIAICAECSPLFSLDFIIECVCLNIAAENEEEEEEKRAASPAANINNKNDANNNNKPRFIQRSPTFNNKHPSHHHHSNYTPSLSPKEKLRRQNIKHMVDVYDRVHLMLTYSSQFIDEIAHKLENNTKREDQVDVGSNSMGIASGLAGIAAAAAIVTPIGPPLIIASLLFGATAQASSSGSKLVNYYSTSNKISLKIISYYNLLKSILVVTTVLKDALLKGDINVENYISNMMKAHDEAMMQLLEDDDNSDAKDDGNAKEAKGWDDQNVDDLTHMGASATAATIPTTSAAATSNTENDFDDDWETDDDSTVVSIRSTISPTNRQQSLDGIKEDETCGEFGDFQNATSLCDMDSIAATPSPKKLSKATIDLEIANNSDATTTNQDKPKKKDEALMERNSTAGKLARFYSRTSLAGSSLVGAATVTVFAGAALSLAHVAFEANNFASTIKRLQAGSPNKRAKILRYIKADIQHLPKTNIIVNEWDAYLAVLDDRRRNGGKDTTATSSASSSAMSGGVYDDKSDKAKNVEEENQGNDLD